MYSPLKGAKINEFSGSENFEEYQRLSRGKIFYLKAISMGKLCRPVETYVMAI